MAIMDELEYAVFEAQADEYAVERRKILVALVKAAEKYGIDGGDIRQAYMDAERDLDMLSMVQKTKAMLAETEPKLEGNHTLPGSAVRG